MTLPNNPTIPATSITTNAKRATLHKKYTKKLYRKSTTGLQQASYTPNYTFLDSIPDDGVHRFILLLLRKRWQETGKTLIEDPSVVNTWFQLSYQEVHKINGWTRDQYQARKDKALKMGLITIQGNTGGACPRFQINEIEIEKIMSKNTTHVGTQTTGELPSIPINPHTLRKNSEGTNSNWDSIVGGTLGENSEGLKKEGRTLKLYRIPINRIDQTGNGGTNNKEPSNKKTVLQFLDSSSIDKESPNNKTCGLQLICDNSTQINKIVREWGKLKNGIAHEIGTNVYSRCSKLLENLLQGKHIQQRKDGKPPLPLQEFYKECIIPEEIQTKKWTPEQIIEILKTVSDQLDCTIGHSMGLDTVLWNGIKRYSRFLVTAAAAPLLDTKNAYSLLAEKLRENCMGWDSIPAGTLALQLQKLHQSFTNGQAISPEAFQYTLEWWINHHTEEYIPQAQTIKELRLKWVKIWNARIRAIRREHNIANPDMGRNWENLNNSTSQDMAMDQWQQMKKLEAMKNPTTSQIDAVMEGSTMICVFSKYWKYYPPKDKKRGYFTCLTPEGQEKRVHLSEIESTILKGENQ